MSPETVVEWIIQNIDYILEKHPELIKKLYDKLKEELEKRAATKDDIKQILLEIKALREDFNKLSAETAKQWESINRLNAEIAKLWDSVNKLSIEIKMLREDFNRISTNLMLRMEALGARWGVLSENAFREGMRYIVEKYFGGYVSRWSYHDDDGFVYGVPSIVDVDVLIKDKKHILVEIKSRIDRSDVAIFKKKAELYKKINNVEPELVMISPYVTDSAIKLAEKLNIRIIKGIPGYD